MAKPYWLKMTVIILAMKIQTTIAKKNKNKKWYHTRKDYYSQVIN